MPAGTTLTADMLSIANDGVYGLSEKTVASVNMTLIDCREDQIGNERAEADVREKVVVVRLCCQKRIQTMQDRSELRSGGSAAGDEEVLTTSV